jgi:hypothetical protein
MTDTFTHTLAATIARFAATSLLGAVVALGAGRLFESADPAFAPIAAVGAWMLAGRGIRRLVPGPAAVGA